MNWNQFRQNNWNNCSKTKSAFAQNFEIVLTSLRRLNRKFETFQLEMLKMAIPGLFFCLCSSFSNNLQKKTVDFSGIRTRIIGRRPRPSSSKFSTNNVLLLHCSCHQSNRTNAYRTICMYANELTCIALSLCHDSSDVTVP